MGRVIEVLFPVHTEEQGYTGETEAIRCRLRDRTHSNDQGLHNRPFDLIRVVERPGDSECPADWESLPMFIVTFDGFRRVHMFSDEVVEPIAVLPPGVWENADGPQGW